MEPRPVNRWMVAITVMLPTLMVIIDTSVVNVSLDHIRGSLSAGVDESTWSITSYLAANAVIIPMTGWLSRYFGRKRILIFSIFLFTISSFLCGLAWNIQSLIFFRILQGLAGGTLQPISQSILLESFPPAQHGTAMAIFGIGVMFGPIIGPLLGGWITDNWSWHWVFFINIPIGIVSLLMSMSVISDPHYVKRDVTSVDYWGLALLAVWVSCLQMVMDRGQREDWFASDFILILTIVAVVAFVVFLFVEYYAEHPIVDLRVFLSYSFVSGNVILFFVMAGLFGSIILLPIYLQNLMGYTAFLAGMILGPGGLAVFVVMPIVGRLVNVVNQKLIVAVGIGIFAYANYLMSGFNMQADFASILWPRIVMSVGLAMVFIPLTTLSLSSIPREEMGNATSVFNLVRNLGGSVGVAFAATMLSRGSQIHQAHLSEHITSFNTGYTRAAGQAAQALVQQGMNPVTATGQGGAGAIYSEMMRQAYMLSFNDAFMILTVILVCMLPFVLIMRNVDHRAAKS